MRFSKMSRKRRKAAPRPTENTVETVLGRLCGCCSLSEQLAIHAQQYDSLPATVNPPDELVVSAPFVSSSQTNISHINEVGLWSEPQGKARGCAQ